MANVADYSYKESAALKWWTGKDIDKTTPNEMIIALVLGLDKNPDEYILYYALADRFQAVGSFAAANEICKKMIELRPADIRSPYAMAINYICLTRPPTVVSPFSETIIQLYFRHLPKRLIELLSPGNPASENKKLSIDQETAAILAIRWLKKTLELKPDDESIALVTQHLNALHTEFPAITD
jgi:tetratricopeptide (TPR) repeat protein